MRSALLALAFLVSSAAPCCATLVTFTLTNREGQAGFDNSALGALTIGGLTATFTPNVGVLNSSLTRFGVDDLTEGASTNDLLDTFLSVTGASTAESIAISFNLPVTVTNIILEDFSGNETAIATIGGNAFTLNAQGGVTDSFDFTTNNTVSLAQTLNLASGPGQPANGLSFVSFTVDVNLAAIPEPSAFLYGGLIALAVGGCQWASRRRFQ